MLPALLVCNFLAFLCGDAAEIQPSALPLQYFQEPSSDPGPRLQCRTCFGDQCLLLSNEACEYYTETNRILANYDDDVGVDQQTRLMVDELFGRVMESAALSDFRECIPLLSKQTDCTKDNICNGCTTCYCDAGGSWNCHITQKCRPNNWKVDHDVLDTAVSNLEASDFCSRINTNNEPIRQARNVFKRDTKAATRNDTISTKNSTDSIEEFKEHVLQPITNIIEEKRDELNELIKIKENLIQLIKTCKNRELDLNSSKASNHSEVYFSIYKLQFEPHNDLLRTKNESKLTKYLNKLKVDMHTVLRDVLSIHKITKSKLPKDLALLVRAMKTYLVHNKHAGFQLTESKAIDKNEDSISRRSDTDSCFIKENVVKVLIAINKTVEPNLCMLSVKTKELIQRFLDQSYKDDYVNFTPYMNYSLDDLLNLGDDFEKYTEKLRLTKAHDKLFVMKTLYLKLMKSISIMRDQLARVNFAQYRRIKNVDQNQNWEALAIIEDKISKIQAKIKLLDNSSIPIKKPFLAKLKNFFKKSKNGLSRLFSRKNYKTSKQLNSTINDDDAIKEAFQEFIRREINPRYKRSTPRDKFWNRMKNILPKYLRRKINPAIEENMLKRRNRFLARMKERNMREALYNDRKLKIQTIAKATKSPSAIPARSENNSLVPNLGELHTRLVFIQN